MIDCWHGRRRVAVGLLVEHRDDQRLSVPRLIRGFLKRVSSSSASPSCGCQPKSKPWLSPSHATDGWSCSPDSLVALGFCLVTTGSCRKPLLQDLSDGTMEPVREESCPIRTTPRATHSPHHSPAHPNSAHPRQAHQSPTLESLESLECLPVLPKQFGPNQCLSWRQRARQAALSHSTDPHGSVLSAASSWAASNCDGAGLFGLHE